MTSDEREESSHSSVGTSESFGDLISLLSSRVESSRQTSEEDGYREVSQPSWERGRTKRKWEGREGQLRRARSIGRKDWVEAGLTPLVREPDLSLYVDGGSDLLGHSYERRLSWVGGGVARKVGKERLLLSILSAADVRQRRRRMKW